ncbi:tRNA (adenosine(37)-N6)-threonylcarbamoyltransferase complex dimerization subunit type 1 TsaB [Shewanella sp. NIFS-20-20]|uniref:tRNA (adenosine(37)-N6)-threonylcarbamoyltransferase complex dimerization subunit type 1 TsaB n=1 Tax=Shewanella sp. NIFS-20-20 TaxID=2853806 RepID=UPI001C44E690|nr:tRNA (adenosine(37)-N6)-threonylcarbamoyltransferase complex dimerization subunit type 1 TsaB [Shewanella sp. NIFS-20-20]MBV7314410.1 tRNA (adenosine(37)-N6)-threonylcarbamoyltransferase complex dimerization subunit type 1 TsaB [Shewanella sp. NIFS-20-20]
MTTFFADKRPAIILALDTCTEGCSAALLVGEQRISRYADAPREHSQRLLPMVDEVLAEANVGLADVDVIAYGRGPGSFTGIRICTSMTQGLALGADLPVVGISTLQTMAQQAIEQYGAHHVLVAIDARMNEVYWGEFRAEQGLAVLVGDEQVSAPETVSVSVETEPHLCGTGFSAYPALSARFGEPASQGVLFPQAQWMLPLALKACAMGDATCVDDLAPVYLRDTVAWKKLPGRE